MYFHKIGWFKTQDYPLKYFGKNWNWQSTDGKWHELVTPFVAKWDTENYHCYWILEGGFLQTRTIIAPTLK